MLSPYPDEFVAAMLTLLNSRKAQRVLDCFPLERRRNVMAAAAPPIRQQWTRNEAYPKDTVGHMMEPALAVFRPEITVSEAVAELRQLVTRAFITYPFIVDGEQRLVGVVAMREMLLARADQPLGDTMVREPFRLAPELELVEAMRATMVRHYPVYRCVKRTAHSSACFAARCCSKRGASSSACSPARWWASRRRGA